MLHSNLAHGVTVCTSRDMQEGALVTSDDCLHLYAGRAAGPTDALARTAARNKRLDKQHQRQLARAAMLRPTACSPFPAADGRNEEDKFPQGPDLRAGQDEDDELGVGVMARLRLPSTDSRKLNEDEASSTPSSTTSSSGSTSSSGGSSGSKTTTMQAGHAAT
jgi:hypothetical protein